MLSIEAPSLKERAQDIPILVSHFIAKANEALHVEVAGIEKTTLQLLSKRPWNGNIRELRNAVYSACLNRQKGILREGDFAVVRLGAQDWQTQLQGLLHTALASGMPPMQIQQTLDAAWLGVMYEAMPNLTKLADTLGIARLTLRKRLKEAGLYHET